MNVFRKYILNGYLYTIFDNFETLLILDANFVIIKTYFDNTNIKLSIDLVM